MFISNVKATASKTLKASLQLSRCWTEISSFCFSQLQLCSRSSPCSEESLNPFWRELGPALNILQHKHGSQLAVRVQKEEMLASNFRSGCNHRLSASIGSLELD
jgi:hypothetical protein